MLCAKSAGLYEGPRDFTNDAAFLRLLEQVPKRGINSISRVAVSQKTRSDWSTCRSSPKATSPTRFRSNAGGSASLDRATRSTTCCAPPTSFEKTRGSGHWYTVTRILLSKPLFRGSSRQHVELFAHVHRGSRPRLNGVDPGYVIGGVVTRDAESGVLHSTVADLSGRGRLCRAQSRST
jgi:hypothetical protein